MTAALSGDQQRENAFGPYVCIAVLFIGAFWSFLANAGVCVIEGRKLSDKDYFNNVIDYVIHSKVDGVVEDLPGKIVLKTVRSQKYSNVEEFLRDFPDCCQIISNSKGGDLEVSVLERIAGVHIVDVNYTKRYLEDGTPKLTKVNARLAVSSCGRVRQ